MLDCRSKYARPGEHHCSSLPSILPIPGMDTLHRLPLSEQNAIDPERRGEVGEILVEYKAHRDTGANLEPVLFFNSRIYCYLLELRVVEWLIMEWMLQSRQTVRAGTISRRTHVKKMVSVHSSTVYSVTYSAVLEKWPTAMVDPRHWPTWSICISVLALYTV